MLSLSLSINKAATVCAVHRSIAEVDPDKKRKVLVVTLHALPARTREREVALGDVMAQPRQRRRRVLVAALLVLLSLCCLARLGGAAASAASRTDRKDGATTATEKAAGQEAARGFTATTAEEELPVRMEMEVDVQDYPGTNANARHDPGYPRGPQHP